MGYNKKFSKHEIMTIKKLYHEGFNVSETAKKMARSRSGIRNVLIKAGLPPLSREEFCSKFANPAKFKESQVFDLIGRSEKVSTKGELYYDYKCKNCSKITARKNANISITSSCPKCGYTLEYINRVSETQINIIRKSAASRKIDFELTSEYLTKLILEQEFICPLSGLEITLPKNPKQRGAYAYTASLDRIDSSKGYIEGNVQWLHKKINVMKFNLSQEDFINFCRIITEHQEC